MSIDGWQLEQANLLGNETDITALKRLALAWETLSPGERDTQIASLQARYPDLELTAEDVLMIVTKFHEMGDIS